MRDTRLIYGQAPEPEALDHNPDASHWLKQAWAELYKRDPVDATRDAELLHMWSIDRLARITREVNTHGANTHSVRDRP